MTTSGQFSLEDLGQFSQNSMVTDALEILQAAGSGETEDGRIANTARVSLNKMLKRWEAQGIHLWTYTEYSLFFVRGQAIYDLRLPATRIVNEFKSTFVTVAALAAATSVTVNDDSELSVGQAIGFIDSTSNLFWTVIERLPGAGVVQFRDALTSDVAVNAITRYYDTAGLGNTTLAANSPLTNIIQVASTVGLVPNLNIAVTDDVGGVQFSTINSIDFDTDLVTLNDAITAASTLGNVVFFYSSEQNFKPIARVPDLSVRRHAGENSDYEIPIVFLSREDYMDLPNKKQIGTPIQAYYSRQRPQGIWYLWNVPSDATEYLNFTAERQLEVMTADPNETFDLPEYWADAITYNLAKLLIPKVGCSPQRRIEIRADAEMYLNEALSFDSAVYPIRLKPRRYG